ncbi:GMC oxidoreductase [Aaosphaeria arxii CBS 175.79]|uniref:GMC oxidoreductase n=1 Tax=Aaosphaeria arxii CBS 175.79 TaxID=1450172 RepID=A0A6A5XWG1_9PLEO|nr:GMC oxidoreductase [Aaosphaeria arxii CBS 175.79]KAF2017177.1 GMC oxidoreductase [Aaosphaeria arxii CBS 175.79]
MLLSIHAVVVTFLGICASLSAATPLHLRDDHIGAPQDATFDYIVVGGGTTGLTVAARLSEHASVAVIEAGGYYQITYGNNSVVPLYSLTRIDAIDPSPQFPRRPEIDWELVTVPQTNAFNRTVHYAQGKTLGGSSAFNTMSYLRSTSSAYQRWASMVGDNDYTFKSLLPFFKKSVRLTPPNLEKRNSANATPEYDPSAYGDGSPLDVSWNNFVDPTLTWLAKSLQAIGIPINPKGFSSGELKGGAWLPSTIDPAHATRESSQTSFLDYADANTQIKVYPYSIAVRVLFENETATGVSVDTNGTIYTLSATKEVIVSAGVFNSPKLLMLSGIGPTEVLTSFDIPVVANLPGVGQNLQDPTSINVANFVNTPNAQSIVANPATEPEALRKYVEEAAGPYSSAAGYISYERLPDDLRQTLPPATLAKFDNFPSDFPDSQYIVGTFVMANGSSMGAISSTFTRTFSRGSVTLASADYKDNPLIDLGWFSDPADADVLIAGVKRVRQAWSSEPALTIRLGAEVLPGDTVDTDEEILSYIKNNGNQLWHASSTCSMGKAGDKSAVVDSKGRVFGVKGLRVADLSVVPYALPGHCQANAYALGEKIARDIIDAR